MNYFIGIDGGGTKTAFACMDENNQVVYQATYESCHILQVTRERAIAILQKGIEEMVAHFPQLTKNNTIICAGLAGYGKDQQLRQEIEIICKQSFKGYPFMICSDADIALYGALKGKDGILLIAGTGSIGLARKDKQLFRSGGWGYQLGDEGSAYWMARQLLQIFTKQVDGRLPESSLKHYLCEQLGLQDPYEIIRLLSSPKFQQRDEIAKLSLYLYELAKRKDPYALEIYECAAKELAQIANTLADYFKDEVCLSYAGGVWKSKDFLLKPFYKYINQKIKVNPPIASPVIGACYYARDHRITW